MGRLIYRQALQLLLPRGMPLQLSLRRKTEGRLGVVSTTEWRIKTQWEKQAGGGAPCYKPMCTIRVFFQRLPHEECYSQSR